MASVSVATMRVEIWSSDVTKRHLAEANLQVDAIVRPGTIILERGNMGQRSDIWIVDPLGCSRQDAIFSALFLRNQGYNVFLCRPEDIPDQIPESLIITVEQARLEASASGRSVHTEVFVSAWAIEYLGDIQQDVNYFEQEFLS